jgi:Raf kinase inhibitor-like YbhB/YbcL family protein
LFPIIILCIFIFSSLKKSSAKIEAANNYDSFIDYDFHQGNFAFRVMSFMHKGVIPEKYTCEGDNISPSFRIYNIPQNSKSLALSVVDADAPSGEFAHWLVFNIPTNTNGIAEGVTPEGASVGVNDFGNNKYEGPCPPKGSGEHRYFFNIYALDIKPDLNKKSKLNDFRTAIKGHIIKETGYMGVYQKK